MQNHLLKLIVSLIVLQFRVIRLCSIKWNHIVEPKSYFD